MKSFYCVPIADLINDTISSLCVDSTSFFAGTEEGWLYRFAMPETDDPTKVANSATLEKKLRVSEAKKKIEKIVVVESLNLLVCLEGGSLHLLPRELASAGCILCKNVSTFCVQATTSSSTTNTERGVERAVGLCVGQKKKLVFFVKRRNSDFTILKEISLNDVPLALCWLHEWLCVNTRKAYLGVQYDKGEVNEILAIEGPSAKNAPQMLLLPDGEIMLIGLENLGIFYNLLTQTPSQRNTIKWPADLAHVCACLPYLVGVTAAGQLEVYSIHGLSFCNALHLPPPLTATASSDKFLLVASGASVSCLLPVPFKQQLYKLMSEGCTREALELLSANFAVDDPRRAEELSNFHNLAGWVEFSKLHFFAAFKHFAYATVDVLRIMSFWSEYLPSWWKTPSSYLTKKEVSKSFYSSADALIPSIQPISCLIRGKLEQNEACKREAVTGDPQADAEHQVLLELANSSLATFLSRERTALMLRPSQKVNFTALQEVAAASENQTQTQEMVAESEKTGSEQLLQLLLSLADTLLFLLLVESDDEKWRDLLSNIQQPVSCRLEDCRSQLLKMHRPDALAALLTRFNHFEEALEVWAQILRGDLPVTAKAATCGNGVHEMLQLLAALADEALLTQQQHQQQQQENVEAKTEQYVEELFKRYAPLVLQAEPQLALCLFLAPALATTEHQDTPPESAKTAEAILPSTIPAELFDTEQASDGNQSRCRISPLLAMELLSKTVKDEDLRDQLQQLYIEEIVINDCSAAGANNVNAAQRRVELGSLATQLAYTYINRLLTEGPTTGENSSISDFQENLEMKKLREKLLLLLEFRDDLNAEALLAKVKNTWLLKETALLHGRLGQHEEALEILAIRLRDDLTAQAYCLMMNTALQAFLEKLGFEEYFERNARNEFFSLRPESFPFSLDSEAKQNSATTSSDNNHWKIRSIFAGDSIWKVKTDGISAGIPLGSGEGITCESFVEKGIVKSRKVLQESGSICKKNRARRSAGMVRALLLVLLKALKKSSSSKFTQNAASSSYKQSIFNLLSNYGSHTDLDPVLVLKWLPDDWYLQSLSQYLISSLSGRIHDKMTNGIQEQLSSVAFLRSHDKWARQRAKSYIITAERSCPVCTRRLGTKAFVAFPDGSCVHLQCAQEYSC